MMRSVPATDMLTRLNQLMKLYAISRPTIPQRPDAAPSANGAGRSAGLSFMGGSREQGVDLAADDERVRPAGRVADLGVGRDAEQVVDGGGEVGRVVGRRGRVGGDAVGGADDHPLPRPAAGQRDGIDERPVVAAARLV